MKAYEMNSHEVRTELRAVALRSATSMDAADHQLTALLLEAARRIEALEDAAWLVLSNPAFFTLDEVAQTRRALHSRLPEPEEITASISDAEVKS